MTLVSALYRLLRTERDLNAIRRGPRAIVKRQIRKEVFRTTARILNRLLK